MSHRKKTKIERFDRQALLDTFAELGVEYSENSTWVAYDPKQSTQVDFLVPHHGNTAVLGEVMWSGGCGFVRDGDTLSLVMDDLDKQTRQAVKAFLKRFQRTYALKVATNQLERFGYVVEDQGDGTYRARATLKTAAKLAQKKTTSAAQSHVQQGRY
jgi:hypothetical protein